MLVHRILIVFVKRSFTVWLNGLDSNKQVDMLLFFNVNKVTDSKPAKQVSQTVKFAKRLIFTG